MNGANAILLNRFFSRNTFAQIVTEGEFSIYAAVTRRYVDDFNNKTNAECIGEIYQYLKKEYPNEYYYKNTLLNKLLLGIHSTKTTTALTEVPIAGSKADFILINGKAVVYEIKTELDNFDRLDGQINDYYRAFSRVVVVTAPQKAEIIQQKLSNSPAGIYLLTKRGTLKAIKAPLEYREALSKSVMFKILRKNEYEQILLKVFGSLPNVSQFDYYRACQSRFLSLSMDVAYQMFINTLKLRMKIDTIAYAKIPYELKFLVYFSGFGKNEYMELGRFLETREG